MNQKNKAMAMLERGPTKAMLNSLDGLPGSPLSSATPPRMNSVILRTSSPCSHGHQGMGELMAEDRGKKEQTGHYSNCPVLPPGPTFKTIGEVE